MTKRLAWDEAKNRTNQAKHHLDFKDAVSVLASGGLDEPDLRVDYGEERRVRLGYMAGVAVAVVYTDLDEHTARVISFRKATRLEAHRLDAAVLQRHRTPQGDV